MPDALLTALKTIVFTLTQIPVVGGLWLWWTPAKARPVSALLLCFIYELGVFAVAFGKKVWTRIEDKAVQSVADWVLATATGFSLGFQRRYKKAIIDEYGGFNVRGLGLINTYRLSLDQVFVDLRIDPGNPQLFNIDLLAKKEFAGNRPIWEFLRRRKEAENTTALAIIGPPGCGKTTLLRHVALTLAANRQHRYQIRAYTPILLFLRDHVTAITQERPPSLGKLVQDLFSDTQFATVQPPVNWFEKRLGRGQCMVLLDGLDEVAEIHQRKKVSAWVDVQIRTYSQCPFVLTARPQGYLDAPLEQADVVLEVQPFNAEQVRRFIDSWYLANEIMSSGGTNDASVRQRANKDARDLLKRLRLVPSLSALTVNPLLLTMIAMVHRYRGALPGSRVGLYAEICEVLLERWRQARGLEDKLKANQKLVVLRPLAAHMMTNKLRDIRTEGAIPIIRGPLNRVGITGEGVNSFLVELQANSGLLLEREAGCWSFAHLTFQEYLTAAHWLEQKSTPTAWRELVNDSWWHETLRLYAAQGDATPLVKACLEVDTVSTLTLAADCLDESRELSPDVRRATEDCLVSGLDSTDTARRHLAAEVRLSRRLNSFQHIDDYREIDMDYLTCSEYQLFLDDMRAHGKYYQPDHWKNLTYPSGQGNKPVSGVRPKDALVFCDWLTRRQGGNFKYRLPFSSEADQYLVRLPCLGTWSFDEHNNRFIVSGLAPADLSSIGRELANLSNSTRTLPKRLDVDLADEVVRAYTYSRLDRFQRTINTKALINQLEVCIRDAPTNRGDYVGRLMIDNARTLARRLNLTIARNIDIVFARNLDEDMDVDVHLAGLAAALSRSLELALELARNVDEDFEDIIAAVQRQDFESALQMLLPLMNDSNVDKADTAIILNDLINMTKVESVLSARLSRRSLFAQIFEQPYIPLEIDRDRSQTFWRQFWMKFASFNFRKYLGGVTPKSWQNRKKESEQAANQENMREAFLNAFWYLKILLAREEGKLPAWEGIRLVREDVSEIGGDVVRQLRGTDMELLTTQWWIDNLEPSESNKNAKKLPAA